MSLIYNIRQRNGKIGGLDEEDEGRIFAVFIINAESISIVIKTKGIVQWALAIFGLMSSRMICKKGLQILHHK